MEVGIDRQAQQGVDTALPATRHAAIAQFVQAQTQASVAALMERFGISRDTVRRDLALLEERGLVVRTHGGAVTPGNVVNPVTNLPSRMTAHQDAKVSIARLTGTLIRNDETLVLNGGSTTAYVAAHLGHCRRLTVVTNNIRVPSAIPDGSAKNVYVLGGAYIPFSQATVGNFEFQNVLGIRADTAIIGVSAISEQGYATGSIEEAQISAQMMRAARRSIIVADASKFESSSLAMLASLESADIMVTNEYPPQDLASILKAAEVMILVAN